MDSKLIIDVGVNNGDDTANYLESGFRVVGIEANPDMVAACVKRFHEPLRDGRLILLNVAIAEQDGLAEFYVSEGNRSVWSSLDPGLAGRTGLGTRAIQVPARRFRSVLEEFGVPYYLKIDIEGADHLCLREIDASMAPRYISFEASEGRIESLLWLALAGYKRFRLVDQLLGFVQVTPPPMHSWSLACEIVLRRIGRRLGAARGVAAARRRLRELATPHSDEKHSGVQTLSRFPVSSSGPRPDESGGPWRSLEETLYAWLYYVRPTTGGSWYDVHAALE